MPPHLGAQQASWAQVGGADTLRSSPAPAAPSQLPLLILLASLRRPQGPAASPDLAGLPPSSPGPTLPAGGFGGWGVGLGAQQARRTRVGRANALCSCPAPPFPEGPSRLPLFISPASLLCPQDHPSLEGTSEGIGSGLRARQTSPAGWAGETLGPLSPDPSPQGSLQAWEGIPPLLSATPQGRRSCPASTSPPPQFPHILLVLLGVLPVSLGVRVPTSIWQAP